MSEVRKPASSLTNIARELLSECDNVDAIYEQSKRLMVENAFACSICASPNLVTSDRFPKKPSDSSLISSVKTLAARVLDLESELSQIKVEYQSLEETSRVARLDLESKNTEISTKLKLFDGLKRGLVSLIPSQFTHGLSGFDALDDFAVASFLSNSVATMARFYDRKHHSDSHELLVSKGKRLPPGA